MANVMKEVVGNKPALTKVARDSDGDGVMDMLDCKPNDKTKQGVIHSIGAGIARRFGNEEVAEKIEKRGAERDEERKEFREAERESFRAERLKVADKRGKERATRKPISQSFGAFLGDIRANQPKRLLSQGQRKAIVGKRKEKKGQTISDILNNPPKFF